MGVTSSLHAGSSGAALVEELAPLRENALDGHPWRDWAEWAASARRTRRASGCRAPPRAGTAARTSRWEPLRSERVAEVAYDHLQGDRFRHATTFRRWRPDKPVERLPVRPAGDDRRVRAGAHLRGRG